VKKRGGPDRGNWSGGSTTGRGELWEGEKGLWFYYPKSGEERGRLRRAGEEVGRKEREYVVKRGSSPTAKTTERRRKSLSEEKGNAF